jgi:hypothetical protein
MAFLIQSVILCALFTLAITRTMRDPINGILSYPPAIRRRVESLPRYQETIRWEKKAHMWKKLLAVPIFSVILAGACWLGGARTFPASFLYGLGLFLVVNLWDLVVLDWLWFCRSPKVRLPGTEDMDREYRDPWFHLRGFLIGVGIGAVVSLLSSGLLAAFRILLA